MAVEPLSEMVTAVPPAPVAVDVPAGAQFVIAAATAADIAASRFIFVVVRITIASSDFRLM
jgi:hypothetical protein